jgi:hypothetical protein
MAQDQDLDLVGGVVSERAWSRGELQERDARKTADLTAAMTKRPRRTRNARTVGPSAQVMHV